MSQENIQLVTTAFAAALQGDAATAGPLLASDVFYASTYPAHLPFGGEARGPEQTLAKLKELTSQFERLSMDVTDIVAQGDSVILMFNEEARSRATGKTFQNPAVFWAKVRDGKVSFARLFPNSYGLVESMRTDEAPRPPRAKKAAKKNTVKNALKAATTGKARAGKSAGKNKVQAAKKGKAGKSTARARR